MKKWKNYELIWLMRYIDIDFELMGIIHHLMEEAHRLLLSQYWWRCVTSYKEAAQ
jgi:hypothetical protein